jgi:hypothetical protein
MDLQTSLLVAALATTLLGVGGYALLLRERVQGLERQAQALDRQMAELEELRKVPATVDKSG